MSDDETPWTRPKLSPLERGWISACSLCRWGGAGECTCRGWGSDEECLLPSDEEGFQIARREFRRWCKVEGIVKPHKAISKRRRVPV